MLNKIILNSNFSFTEAYLKTQKLTTTKLDFISLPNMDRKRFEELK